MSFADVMGWNLGMQITGIEIPNRGWESGNAGGWTLGTSGFGYVGVRNVDPRSGVYHLEGNCYAASPGASTARYDHPRYADYKGKTITFSVYAKRVLPYGPGTQYYIALDDGVGITKQNMPTGGTYTLVSVSRTLDLNASRLRFFIAMVKAAAGSYLWRIDDMSAVVKQ